MNMIDSTTGFILGYIVGYGVKIVWKLCHGEY